MWHYLGFGCSCGVNSGLRQPHIVLCIGTLAASAKLLREVVLFVRKSVSPSLMTGVGEFAGKAGR